MLSFGWMGDSSRYKSILHFRLGTSPGCSFHCEAPLPIVIARHLFLLSLWGTSSYCHCEAPLLIVIVRHPFLLSLWGTFSYCHCEAPLPIVIVRRPFLLSLWGAPSYCHCEAQSAEAISRNARGVPRLRLAMTGKGDNDKARKQCVTNLNNIKIWEKKWGSPRLFLPLWYVAPFMLLGQSRRIP